MEENAKKLNYEEMFNESKETILAKLESLTPDFYHVMHDENGKLLEQRLENIAEWFARHCDYWNENERKFMYYFVKCSVIYLHENCLRSDFSFEGMQKLANTVKLESRYVQTIYELAIERFLKRQDEDYVNHTLMTVMLRICNADYIHCEFSEKFKSLMVKWKELFFKDMIRDEHYKEAYEYASNIHQKMKKKNLSDYLNEHKIKEHIKNHGLFKFIRFHEYKENINYDYSEFVNQLVEFVEYPEIGDSARWQWLGYEDEDDFDYIYWHTSPVKSIHIRHDRFIIRTANTAYEFIVDDGD